MSINMASAALSLADFGEYALTVPFIFDFFQSFCKYLKEEWSIFKSSISSYLLFLAKAWNTKKAMKFHSVNPDIDRKLD